MLLRGLIQLQQRKICVIFTKFRFSIVIDKYRLPRNLIRALFASKNIFAIHNALRFNTIFAHIFIVPQPFEQHYVQSYMNINPVIGAPIVWHPGIVQN